MTGQDHYFSARPATPDQRQEVAVDLMGRRFVVETAPGIFSPGGLDKGTAVLLGEVPNPPPGGDFLDIGCGWGPIAISMAILSPAAHVHAIDVNERSLDLTRRNAERLGCTRIRASLPAEVDPDLRFDLIWSNPPIRIGKAALHDLLRTWLPRLGPGGTAYLVVQRNLGSDSLARWIEADLGMPCARLGSHKGFRVLEIKAGRP